MEKYGVEQDPLLEGLRNEEAQLMTQMAKVMGTGSKHASDTSQLEARLQAVRAQISAVDLERMRVKD